MRWIAFVLLTANAVVGAYFMFESTRRSTQPEIAGLELNPDQVKTIAQRQSTSPPPAAGSRRSACLEWSGFTATEAERARVELEKAQVANVSVRHAKVTNPAAGQRDREPSWVIVIVDATPALAARLVELRTGFPGTDVKAAACAA